MVVPFKMPVFVDPNQDQCYVDSLFAIDAATRLEAVTNIKNAVIGNNSKKSSFMTLGVIPRILELMTQDDTDSEFLIEAAVVLGSFARGTEENIKSLLECHALQVLMKGLIHPDCRIVEACVRSLRSLYLSLITPTKPVFETVGVVPQLVQLLKGSFSEAECAAQILTRCCQNSDNQMMLYDNGAVNALAPLLASDVPMLQFHALRCYAVMLLRNETIGNSVRTTYYQNDSVPRIISGFLASDKSEEIRLNAAKCITNMFRSQVPLSSDSILQMKVLPTLVRLCKKDKQVITRAQAADTLAYLIEEDVNLQKVAAISDHLLCTLSGYFNVNEADDTTKSLMRESALKAYASLAANDEDIRKKIIEMESTMERVVRGLEDASAGVRLGAARCLHSLSRSVQQLRTSFQDASVWKPLMKLLENASDELLSVSSSALCNLLLEFSPSKEPILESGAIILLSDLTRHNDSALRLNGVWALMNMAYQADERTKTNILNVLGPSQLFHLLEDSDIHVTMKALGMIRNLLSGREDIDRIMGMHGQQVMMSIRPIIDGDSHPCEIREQALCVLANIGNGLMAKDYIMSDEVLLKKLMDYMNHKDVKLQMAATYCISNLVWNTEEGSFQRQSKLRDLGVQKLLQNLLARTSTDQLLFDRVKTALQQFS